MATLFMLSSVSGNAQIKNQKTKNIKISGNCGMCKAAIEKAGNMKNIASVVWDEDTKIAAVNYDSTKTTSGAILKEIALAGYDSDQYLAPDLPAHCQDLFLNCATSMLFQACTF